MQVNIRHKGSVTILDIEGKIIGNETLTLKRIIDEQVQASEGGTLNLILNMARVQIMDSSGLGILVSSYSSITQNKGRVVLVNLGGNIRSLIVMAKLVTIFERYETEAEAIASFL